MPEQAWNPRYVAYARAHGETPVEMLARDGAAWPGGRMCGFTLWIRERWREWDRAHPLADPDVRTAEDHASFDAWLAAR
jgi:hypothetical protein